VGNPGGGAEMTCPERPRRRCQCDVKTDVKEIRRGVDRALSSQNWSQWRTLVNTVIMELRLP
jgi:hypothetical protein